MRVRNIFAFLIIFLMSSLSVGAQEATPASTSDGMPLRISYFGDNFKNPGLRLGTSYILHKKVKLKTRKGRASANKKSKTKVIHYKLDGNLGFYNQPNNHFGIPIGIGLTRHKNVNERKLSTGLSFEINYLRRFYNIDTYDIDENGNIEELGLAGNGGLAFTLAPLFERAFGPKDLIVFIKPMIQFNKYNHAFAVNYAFEIGVTLNVFKR